MDGLETSKSGVVELDPTNRMPDDDDPNQRGWRKVVRNFGWSWYTVNMGTGIVSILLHQLPYNGIWLYWLSVIVFCLNVLLFTLFTLLSTLRYVLWPEIWSVMIHHPSQALFLGAVPMGLGTIVNMIVYVCVPAWGDWAALFAFALWIVDAAMSVVIALYLPFITISRKDDTKLSTITALQLFPSVAPVVTSVVAGTVASSLTDHPQLALASILAGYVLWGVGFPTALLIMTIYYQRLVLHKLPPRELIISVWLPLGPPSLGAYSLIELGRTAEIIFPLTHTIHPMAGVILYNLGVIIALVFWGYALLWFFFAVAALKNIGFGSFNMGWWGLTFPIGCFAISSGRLGQVIPSRFFRIVGTIVSVCVFILWMIVAFRTARDALAGKLFNAPELRDLEKPTRNGNISAV